MIDPALAALAFDLPPAPSTQTALTAQQSQDLFPPDLPYGELGEMGGKRKKRPHERAGWAEIEAIERAGKGGKKFRKGIDGLKESRATMKTGIEIDQLPIPNPTPNPTLTPTTSNAGAVIGVGVGIGSGNPAGTLEGDLAQAGMEQGVDQHEATLNFSMEQGTLEESLRISHEAAATETHSATPTPTQPKQSTPSYVTRVSLLRSCLSRGEGRKRAEQTKIVKPNKPSESGEKSTSKSLKRELLP
jgi:hypothetical protein